MESPDNRLKSSRTEAAEVGAEESEEEALPAAGAADGAEMREQPSRESSAVRGSERKQWHRQEVQSHTHLCVFNLQVWKNHNKNIPVHRWKRSQPMKGRWRMLKGHTHLSQTPPQNR